MNGDQEREARCLVRSSRLCEDECKTEEEIPASSLEAGGGEKRRRWRGRCRVKYVGGRDGNAIYRNYGPEFTSRVSVGAG